MNPGAILIGIAMFLVAVLYVISPVVYKPKRQPVKAASLNKDGKDLQKDTLSIIHELDFDYQTGKVTQEDYKTLRMQLVRQAAEYIQIKKQEDEKIEEMIRIRLQNMKPSIKCENCGGVIHSQDRFCPTCGVTVNNLAVSEKPVVKIICHGCGKRIKEGDLFCANCGVQVESSASQINLTAEN